MVLDHLHLHPATQSSSHLIPCLSSYFSTTLRHPPQLHLLSYLFDSDSLLYNLKLWYLNSEPLASATTLCLALSVLCWFVSELTGNVSQVDRLWTFLPVFYSFHFFNLASKSDIRMTLVLICQIAWSLRLTTNSIRRGFFDFSKEDYRWEVLRKRIPGWQMKLINLTFIAFIQNLLLLATSLPQYLLYTTQFHVTKYPTHPLNVLDGLITLVFFSILALEMVADNQQQNFQTTKHVSSTVSESHHSPVALKRGFLTSGLFKHSRHPNFACEQLTWYIIYAFTLSATIPGELFGELCACSSIRVAMGELVPYVLNYSIISPIAMSTLFYASTLFTESISASKYPAYVDYQKTTDMFWPPLTLLRRAVLRVWWSERKRTMIMEKVFGQDVDPKMI
ncbi:hypothetical protein CROQUDRAFT_657037 [Cronartium quercuum f. sp. fusiforme G11]|uniref:Steroid 5-alpha reductase C-terminal domain-containing protein n=1 Tax=Cronartium quercuum f. sp. fusiforme G11 TaxID=708437 RepID=A0A9P6NNF9_9BASI|nr:hypothetical protein CROQUDRAFT_657037 [Cronartium quercuum f. sp. fusiforme G11]